MSLAQSESSGQSIEQLIDRPWPWSIWLTILVALLIAAAVVAIYYSERGQASLLRRLVLASLRIAALMLLFWMIAGWNIQRFKSDFPELVMVIDDSASMQTVDGAEGRTSRWEAAKQVLERLWQTDSQAIERYHPKLFAISNEARELTSDPARVANALDAIKPNGELSRLGDGVVQLLQRQSGRPTAAIVLVSDGIVTHGMPLDEAANLARRLAVPIFCVVTGQQLPQPDLALVDLLTDDAVYLGDRVNVQVSVVASDVTAHRATVNLRDMQSGQVVDTMSVDLSTKSNTTAVQLSYVPSAPGSSLIKLEVTPAPNEKNLQNNVLEHVIEVRDQTLRILLVQKSPSYEFRFLKTLLERTSHLGEAGRHAFELDVVLQDADATHVAQDAHALRLVPGDRETIASYDVVVFGEFDASLIAGSTQKLIVDQIVTSGCGCLFICDPVFDKAHFSGWPIAKLLPIDLSQTDDATWRLDGTVRRWRPTVLGQSALPLQLTDAASASELWRTLPGPQWQYVAGRLKPGAQVLAAASSTDRSGETESPLLISQFVGAGRVLMQTTDETYRWVGYRGSDLTYQRYWIQMLRWLSRGKLNRQNQSELSVEPRQAKVGETIQFAARLNPEDTAQLGSHPASIAIERIAGETKVIAMQRTQSALAHYKASDSSLAAGSYKANIREPSDTKASSVTFTVTAPPGEQANLRSDWTALRNLAEQTHGKFMTAREAETLLAQLPKGSPVRRGSLPPLPLWNSAWIALAFVCLLTLEWILRKSSNML